MLYSMYVILPFFICLVMAMAISLALRKEQDNFVKLCGQGDLESVTQLLANDPSLIKAKGEEKPCKL